LRSLIKDNMKKIVQILFLAPLVAFLMSSCSSDNDTVIEDEPVLLAAEILLDVAYGPNARQIYDLYLPEGRTKENTKIIVLIHGGGWTSGDKADMSNFVSLLQENYPDYAVVNMNYVLAEEGVPAFPNQFLDVDSVITQLSSQEEDLQIKAEFGLIGTSAGAHIAMMYDYSYDITNKVKFVANIVGPTDFTDPFYANSPNFQLAISLLVDENAYPQGTNFAEAVSPVYQVTSSSSPTILFYGDQDPLVPLSNGETLKAALNSASVPISFNVYAGGHGNDWSLGDYIDLQSKLGVYIETYLPLQ
jgi:acetyl esterase/lipase